MDIIKNKNGKFLGIDIGTKRVGIALSNSSKSIAFPNKVVLFKNKEDLLNEIQRIIENENIEKIIIGDPINTKGMRSSLTDDLYKLIDYLKNNLKIDICLYDERYSTQEAHSDLHSMKLNWKKRKELVDKVAAAIILQNYIESLQVK